MKHLKCIGGVCDGTVRAVRPGEKVVVIRRYLPAVATFAVVTMSEPTCSYDEFYYLICTVETDGGVIEFLRPNDWTAAQALRHVLAA
jgi:hypothetical protein